MPDQPTQTPEDAAVAAVQQVLDQLHPNDRFRVLSRINTSANIAGLQYERDEFNARRERYRRINRGDRT